MAPVAPKEPFDEEAAAAARIGNLFGFDDDDHKETTAPQELHGVAEKTRNLNQQTDDETLIELLTRSVRLTVNGKEIKTLEDLKNAGVK